MFDIWLGRILSPFHTDESKASDAGPHITIRLGVWEIIHRKSSRSFLSSLPNIGDAEKILTHFSVTRRFIKDMYSAAPRQFIIYALHKAWMSIESGLSLYFRGRLMDAILRRFQGAELDGNTVARALAAQVLLVVAKGILESMVRRQMEILRDRVKFHFMTREIHAKLTIDSHSIDGGGPQFPFEFDYKEPAAWHAFEGIFMTISAISRAVSQFYFGLKLVKQQPFDPLFLLASFAQPFFSYSRYRGVYSLQFVSYCKVEAYKRILALQHLVFKDRFKKDIQSDGVGPFIEREYAICRGEVGDMCTEEAHEQWSHKRSATEIVTHELMSTLPTLYFALRAIFYPDGLTLRSFTLLQSVSQSVSWTVYMLSNEFQSLASKVSVIEGIYTTLDAESDIKDGDTTYPLSEEEDKTGMSIEFRNVCFEYPGTSKNALEDVSFLIKPGQLVAIVGVNGSGKSSIVNLFNRLYDPTEGVILVDGVPLPSFKVVDVRRSMAVLRQTHRLYPLSLRENIALGLPGSDPSEGDFEEALRSGGAYTFVSKLPNGLDTGLNPVRTVSGTLSEDDIEELRPVFESETWTDVSGGENQRLAASRTFMRLRGGNIRLLAADEPTSALDPEGEYDLFSKLKQQRGGMTVVFITHRFGHITRHADLILCMKDGRLVEKGTHEELISKGEESEYYKLHSVQAQAFSDETTATNPQAA